MPRSLEMGPVPSGEKEGQWVKEAKEWKKALEDAEKYYSAAKAARDNLRLKRQNKEPIGQNDLRKFLEASRTLYNHLEQMIPRSVRKAYIEKELKKTEEWLAKNLNSPNAEAVERQKERLLAAQKRLERERVGDNIIEE